jgi:hypothetical protein
MNVTAMQKYMMCQAAKVNSEISAYGDLRSSRSDCRYPTSDVNQLESTIKFEGFKRNSDRLEQDSCQGQQTLRSIYEVLDQDAFVPNSAIANHIASDRPPVKNAKDACLSLSASSGKWNEFLSRRQ